MYNTAGVRTKPWCLHNYSSFSSFMPTPLLSYSVCLVCLRSSMGHYEHSPSSTHQKESIQHSQSLQHPWMCGWFLSSIPLYGSNFVSTHASKQQMIHITTLKPHLQLLYSCTLSTKTSLDHKRHLDAVSGVLVEGSQVDVLNKHYGFYICCGAPHF